MTIKERGTKRANEACARAGTAGEKKRKNNAQQTRPCDGKSSREGEHAAARRGLTREGEGAGKGSGGAERAFRGARRAGAPRRRREQRGASAMEPRAEGRIGGGAEGGEAEGRRGGRAEGRPNDKAEGKRASHRRSGEQRGEGATELRAQRRGVGGAGSGADPRRPLAVRAAHAGSGLVSKVSVSELSESRDDSKVLDAFVNLGGDELDLRVL